MNGATNTANGFGGVMGSVTNAVKGFIIYDVGKKLIEGFTGGIKAGIEYNATLEQSKIKWETLLGTQEKANKMLKEIEQFASTTPFEKMGVDKMASYLNNAGFEGKALFDQLTKFGDVAGAFSVTNDDLKEMVRQYSQVKNAGIAYTEDLNILEDKSVPIMKHIAEVMKVPQSEVKKLASDGKISFDIYNQALDNIAKKSEGGMAKMSESFNGVNSTIKDTMGQIAGTLAKPIFENLKSGALVVRDVLSKVAEKLAGGDSLLQVIQEFAPQAMPFIQSIIGIFNTLKDSVKVIIDAIMGFWEEHKGWIIPLVTFVWGFICSFIGTTITAIGTLVQSGLAVIDGIINFFQNLFSGNFSGCWESIKQIFTNAIIAIVSWMQVSFAVGLGNIVKGLGKSIPQAIKFMWSSVKSFFTNGVSSCLQFARSLFSGASNSFNMLKTFGANTFQALWSVARTMMSNLLSSVTSSIRQVPTTVKNFMTQAVNVIKNINLFSVGKNMIQGLINGIKNMAGSVVGAIGGVVTGAVNAAKKKLGINSPSKVFMEFGQYTGEGLAIGIDKENKRVSKASMGLSNSVIGGYSANLKGAKLNVNNSSSNSLNSSNSNQPIIIQSVLDGKIIAESIANFTDIVNGNRLNLTERGLVL